MNIVSVFKNAEASNIVPLPPARLIQAKAAYTTRRVDMLRAVHLLTCNVRPQAGDLVMARIEEIGQHTRIELVSGRRALLHIGDEVIACYGNRYAPDQFEAYVPADLSSCDLVAAGGVAARMVNRHTSMKRATRIAPLGILADAGGRPLNLRDYALLPTGPNKRRPFTIAVVGTSMNAGKTTVASSLIRGYKRQGHHVGAAKVTGTGAGCDVWSMLDAGADHVLDFTDCGLPSTFGENAAVVEGVFTRLTTELGNSGATIVVLEIADGVFQDETAALIRSSVFAEGVDAVIFAAGDALGAQGGVKLLSQLGLPVIAVSGLLTASPLAIREAAAATGVPVVSVEAMNRGSWLPDVGGAEMMPAQAVPPGRCDERRAPDHPFAAHDLARASV